MKHRGKVLLAQPIHPDGMRMLQEGVEEVVVCPDSSPETILAHLDDRVEGVVVRYNRFSRAMFEKAPRLKVVARHGIGVELIDLQAATEHRVMVVNTPDAATESVAEHVVMMALVLVRKLNIAQAALRAGDYAVKDRYGPDDLDGKTIGFVGLGRIGAAAARRCAALGMQAVAYDPYANRAAASALGVELLDSMESVLRCADVVSLHTPLTEETRHMIGREQLDMMKPTACLINCARGAVLHEEALIHALQTGAIAGAGLDVFEQEPPDPANPLLHMDNVVVTPHSSSLTAGGARKMAVGAARQTLAILGGGEPEFLVNRDLLDQ